ncbi:MAG TPA: transcriptional regulator [Streptosporangiaceae bacterium]|nr:transcriptional regulator [Streptosporangiaceae bacterium]
MTGQRQPPLELTIGVVGPHDLVERVMVSGAVTPATAGMTAGPVSTMVAGWPPVPSLTGSGLARRLVAAAYRSEQEAPDKVVRLGPAIDVFLFASPVPQEYARRAGVLRAPATCVPLSGSALFATLLRARADGRYDLSRISVDVLSRSDVEEAFAELDLPTGNIHVREDPAGAATLAAFHERLWRRGQTSVAFTCLESVAQRLTTAQAPVYVVRPTGSAIRAALRTATLLGAQRRLEEAQLAVIVVEVPTLRETSRRPAPRQSQEELRLTINRFLLQEAQRMQATVSPAGDHTFLVTATRGSLAGITDGFRVPPFADRARSELGVVVEVGVGLGRTAQDAEAHARVALARSHAGPGTRGFALDREGHALVPPPRAPTAVPPSKPKGLETLSRLAEKLPPDDGARVVDAETAGRLLGVTSRTARRLLHTLVEEGLAWPLPPNRTPQPGRPRQFYRLVTEKLE